MEMSHQFSSQLPLTRRGDPIGHVRMSVSERRKYRRDELSLSVTLTMNGESYSAEITEISAGGAQLRCSIVPKNGADILVGLAGYGDLPARVVRRLPSAIAIEFKLPPLQYAEFAERLEILLKAHM